MSETITTVDQLVRHAKPGPRYTSYPPATEFTPSIDAARVTAELARLAQHPDEPIALYCHLPFCRSLCWYCGCNVTATRNRDRGTSYVETLLTELAMIGAAIGGRPVVEIALGGGSPNFLRVDDMTRLLTGLRRHVTISPDMVGTVELDPRDTERAQLEVLASGGFRRMSIGVQDFDLHVQDAINRHQSAAQTALLVADARALGFTQVNIDLVYGLPLQTPDTLTRTLDEVLRIEPAQIALFGYAHLPSRLPHQQLVERAGKLPGPPERAALLLTAAELLTRAGYQRIGFDHFARPDAELAVAAREGRLARSFQGYMVRRADVLIGCGASAISDTGHMYWQNVPDPADWATAVEAGALPIARGVALDADDRLRRDVIEHLMCDGAVDLAQISARHGIEVEHHLAAEFARLAEPATLELVAYDQAARTLTATALGRPLVRNICMVFDRYLDPNLSKGRFSPSF
jgi:oxygen-independent coproporphyrinogen-3 oxidase